MWWQASTDVEGYTLRYAVEDCDPTPCTPENWTEENGLTTSTTPSGITMTSTTTNGSTTFSVKLSAGSGGASWLNPSTVYRLQVQSTNATGASNWSDATFVYPTNNPPGHRVLIGTAPLYGYQAKNAQGSHEFRYVICENTIPAVISSSTAAADIEAAVET